MTRVILRDMGMKNTLRIRRAERDAISQRDLAQLAGISPDRYWRIEKGYADPTEDERAALALALDCGCDVLFPADDTAVASPDGATAA